MAKKVVSFQDFNKEADKADLQNTSRGFSKNSNDGQQIVDNQKMVFNKATRKWDNVTKDMIDDQIKGLESVKESINENTENSNKEIAFKIANHLSEEGWGVEMNRQEFENLWEKYS